MPGQLHRETLFNGMNYRGQFVLRLGYGVLSFHKLASSSNVGSDWYYSHIYSHTQWAQGNNGRVCLEAPQPHSLEECQSCGTRSRDGALRELRSLRVLLHISRERTKVLSG